MSSHRDREHERVRDRQLTESVLATIPLGFPRAAHPESGPNIVRYFKEKHRRGEYGRFYPLHETAKWSRS